jgi:hypothetical protein
MTLLSSVHLLMLGILGEYVGRLYQQSIGRPLFLIETMERSLAKKDAESVSPCEAPGAGCTRSPSDQRISP